MAAQSRSAADLDETRRLLYMGLMARDTKKYNLAGTLVNALVHHHAAGMDAKDAMARVRELLEADGVIHAQAGDWARDQIGRITAELGD